jgi:hypothetical protein
VQTIGTDWRATLKRPNLLASVTISVGTVSRFTTTEAQEFRFMSIICKCMVVTLLAGTTVGAQTPPDQIGAIRKATILFMARPTAPHSTGKIAAICLHYGIEHPPQKKVQSPMTNYTDPTLATLRSLGSVPLPYVPGSHCWADPVKQLAITDTSNKIHRLAMAIILGNPKISPDGKATIEVERVFSGRSANGYNCHAVKRGAAWAITGCDDEWFVDNQ